MCRNWPPPLPLPPGKSSVRSLAHFLDRRRKLTLFASLARLIASSPARSRSVLVRGSVPLPFSPWENLFSFSLTVTRPSVHNRDITNLRPERPGEGRRTDAQTRIENERRANGALWIAAATLSSNLRQPRFHRRDSIGIPRRRSPLTQSGRAVGRVEPARAGQGSLALAMACTRYVT